MLTAECKKVCYAACRKSRVSYDDLRNLFRHLRDRLRLAAPKQRARRLPKLLQSSQLEAYYEAVDRAGNLQHQIMLRLLFYTALRVSELVSIRVADIDLGAQRIYIERGKGDKDRYVLFKDSFALALRAYLAAHPDNEFLFESRSSRPYTPRRIQQIVTEYAAAAGIEERVHPHLFRHQMLTHLTASGMSDAAIQLISGHASKETLGLYQHLALPQVREGYQKAVKDLDL